MRYGYARASFAAGRAGGAALEEQESALREFGVDLIYADIERGSAQKQLQALRCLMPGDTFAVCRLDRLGRTACQLALLAEYVAGRKVRFVSIADGIDTATAEGAAFVSALAKACQAERDVLSEKAALRHSGPPYAGRKRGRKPLPQEAALEALSLYAAGFSASDAARAAGMSRSAFYQKRRELMGNG